MPYDTPSRNIYVGIITDKRKEFLNESFGLLETEQSYDKPAIEVPVYTVSTFPTKEVFRYCLPLIFGSWEQGKALIPVYEIGDMVIIYVFDQGKAYVLGSIPLFPNKLPKQVQVNGSSRSSISVGESEINISVEDMNVKVSAEEIALIDRYADGIVVKEGTVFLPSFSSSDNKVSITPQELEINASNRSLVAINDYRNVVSCEENITTLNSTVQEIIETVEGFSQIIKNLQQEIENIKSAIQLIELELKRVNEENNETPKLKLISYSELPDGGISVVKNEGSNPEKVAKAKTLKQELEELKNKVNSLISKFNTHTHIYMAPPSGGSPAPTNPPSSSETPVSGIFTEDWFSDLIEVD